MTKHLCPTCEAPVQRKNFTAYCKKCGTTILFPVKDDRSIPFDAKKHERGMWRRYYSSTKKKPKKKYPCDQCGELYPFDELKIVSRLQEFKPPKRTCRRCQDALAKINKAIRR